MDSTVIINGKRVPEECLYHCFFNRIPECTDKDCNVFKAWFAANWSKVCTDLKATGKDLSQIEVVTK